METIKGRSAKTVESYYIDLRLFLRYIKAIRTDKKLLENMQQISIADVSQEMICSVRLSDVYEFLNFTLDSRANNAKTRARKVSSLRSFYRYLTTKTDVLKDNPVKDLEVPAVKKSLPKYLDLEQSIELLTHVDTKFTERDFCILTLFLNCGMRVSELCGIRLQDINPTTKQLRLLGKGNKERIIYINEACLDSINAYLEVRKPSAKAAYKNHLFLSQNGEQLTTRRVEQIVSDCLKKAGLDGKGFSPHKLRHTAATLMYQHGNVDIRVLKEILGHENLATTEIYTHVGDQQMQDAALNSPLANVRKKKKED